jgi:hypothetical protein
VDAILQFDGFKLENQAIKKKSTIFENIYLADFVCKLFCWWNCGIGWFIVIGVK